MTASPDNYTWTHRRTVYLAEGCRPAPDPSRLFRPLADLAHDGPYTPSDLMHDAAWLMAHATGPVIFYWAARSGGGTAIGTDPALVSWPGSGGDSYRVTVTREERGHWTATVEGVNA